MATKTIAYNGGVVIVDVFSDSTYVTWAARKNAYSTKTVGSINNDDQNYVERLAGLIAKGKGFIDREREKEVVADQRYAQALELANSVIDGSGAGIVEVAKPQYVPTKRRGFFAALKDSRKKS